MSGQPLIFNSRHREILEVELRGIDLDHPHICILYPNDQVCFEQVACSRAGGLNKCKKRLEIKMNS